MADDVTDAAEMVDELIRAARDKEWQAHFGARWEESEKEVNHWRQKVLAAMSQASPLSDEVVERVARGLFDHSNIFVGTWEECCQSYYRDMARAALTAMGGDNG